MTEAPRLHLREVECYEWPFTLRLPFRFGAITVTHGRQAVVRSRVELADGRGAWGWAAETLAAKWFDKDPALSDHANLDQLRRSLEIARDLYLARGADTAFGFAAATWDDALAEGGRQRLPPLVTAYGPAMLDRCIADGLGRLLGQSFAGLARGNHLGIVPDRLAPDLHGFNATAFLAGLAPLEQVHVRHTVGMVDPITISDQTERVADGLPETLEDVVAAYGQSYFKLKVGGDVARDVDRLGRIAAVLDRIPGGYHATLDGNEQYGDADGMLALARAIRAAPRLQQLRASLLFIEQPIRRAVALERDVSAIAREVAPLLLDESDGPMDAFVRGRALGYHGISSKDCKGIYRSLLNRMRCAAWNGGDAGPYFMSGEDLTTLSGLSVQQDLALAALLGLPHVERNGHHFVDGFNGRPQAEAEAFLHAHPDLYHARDGRVRLRITGGQVSLGSLAQPGFAAGALPDTSSMQAMAASAWRV